MAKKKNKKSLFQTMRIYYWQVKNFFSNTSVQFVIGLLCAAFVIFLASSYISFFSAGGFDQSVVEAVVSGADVDDSAGNTSGRGGAVLANYLVNACFGWSSVFLLPLLVLVAVSLMRLRKVRLARWTVITLFLVLWGSLFFSFVFDGILGGSYISPGGKHGSFLNAVISDSIGVVGVVLVLLVTLLLFMIYLTDKTIPWLREKLSIPVKEKAVPVAEEPVRVEVEMESVPETAGDGADVYYQDVNFYDPADEDSEKLDDVAESGFVVVAGDDEDSDLELARQFDSVALGNAGGDAGQPDDAALSMEVEAAEGDDDMGGEMLRSINPKDELSYYKPPTLDLLDEYEQGVQAIDKNEQAEKANDIVNALKNFGIEISSIKATVGPTITLYEITPAPGIRISKIRNLEDDIAMSLSALCIRIVAPIPGKGTIGIEVPNAHKQTVPMKSLLNSRKYKETNMELPLALGKTISNEVYMVDMAKMPHLLVAGATGMGKSVGLNVIITSLLYKMHPAYLKFVMVDPKMVELSLYNVLEKHFLAKLENEDEPIITDVNKVVRTLKSLCVEMDNRYKLLQMASVRSVKEYNEKFLNKELLPTKGHRFMPYIVVIIDEYGDLMMQAGREIEQPIARIAQKARAVGMHMIIATQRPTTNIITGTIKANFPARMAFRVISTIDSRTILDRSGANQLQGRGDMLFLAGNDPVRVQCALVETKEVERVCAHIANQQGYLNAYILPEPDEAVDMSGDGGGGARGDISSDKLDPLFAEAARIVVLAQHGSTSLIQRKMNIGFNRAGRIMDQLCQTGIVGEQEGSKPRQVLCADEADLEFRLKSLL